MRYKLLGKSDLRLSELCPGTITIGENWKRGISQEESRVNRIGIFTTVLLAVASLVACTEPRPTPTQIAPSEPTEEAEIRTVVAGFVVEVASMEVVSGGAAAKIPVRIVVQKIQGRWMITEYAEER